MPSNKSEKHLTLTNVFVVVVVVFFCTRGYYPKGGGEIHVTVNPVKQLKPLQLLQRGTLSKITGRAYVAGVLPFKVGKLFLIAENPDSGQNL